MDWEQHLRETAAWLVEMARMPGELALEHAKHRERDLMSSSLYADLPRYVREARVDAAH